MRRLEIFLIGTALSFSQLLKAQQISESEAKDKAVSFFNNRQSDVGGALRTPSRGGSNSISPETQVSLAYTAGENDTNYFYVYNNGENDGYVIVGGDEQAKEIIAYVPQGHFVYDSLPDNLKWWLSQYANEIDTAIIMASHMPTSAKMIRRAPASNTLQDIPDLITTKWNQESPYNNVIPLIGEDTLHCPTGCVPTALAQIMNYWKYPTQGIGSKSYTLNYPDINQSMTYTADFANTTYDWSNMLDQYVEGQYTTAQANAVSTLMYHIGVALQVSYIWCGTGYSSSDGIEYYNGTIGLMHDLPAYFGYDEGMQLVSRRDFTLDQWKMLLYNELSAGRPVYYSGNSLEGGHAFVCHGYSSDLDMFSFNWGWGGLEDGYFSLSGTNAVNGFTASSEEMLIGIRPKGHNCGVSELSFGDKFMVDGIWYRVWNEQKREVEVTHTTITDPDIDITDYEYCYGNVTIPSHVQHDGIDYTVSRIGTCAFLTATNGQTNVESISLPPTITSLGAGAFYYCQFLSDSIIIPDAVEIIPNRCFQQCNRSPYISIPSSVKSIGTYAFYGCRLLEELSLPEGCYKVSSFAFYGCNHLSIVNLPSTFFIFGDCCFDGTNIIKMSFPCDKFVSAQTYTEGQYTTINFASPFPSSIGKGVLYVPETMVDTYRNTTDPFWSEWGNVESLNDMNPNIGRQFNADEFKYMILNDSCVTLTEVIHVDYSSKCITVPSSVTFNGITYKVESLAAGAFAYQGFYVSGIDKLVLSEGIKEIGETALQDCEFKSIELPNSLEKIGTDAFNNCHELESLDIPGSVKIAQGLSQCASLKQVILHEGTQFLGPNFLANCPKLKEVLFPSSICHYAGGTMTACDALSSIVSLSDSLSFESLGGWYAWGYGSNHESVSLYIPEQYLSDGESDYNNKDPWTQFPNKLQYVALESFEISDTVDIVVNEQRMIHQEFFPANASYKQLKWRSSDEEIAFVNCEGYIYAMSEGEVTVTASSVDGSNIVRSCVVRVHAAAIPPIASYYCVYKPEFIYQTDYSSQQDTISFAVSSEDGELYLAFILRRETNSNNNLSFSIGNHVYDIIPTCNDRTVILHFDNVQEQDTLRMIWNKIHEGWTGSLIVSNIRIWNPNYVPPTYAIIYNLDGNIFRTDSILYGDTIVSAADPIKEGYTFSGWSEIPAVMPANDIEVTGTFSINKYIVTFINYDNDTLQIDTLEYGLIPLYQGAIPLKESERLYTYTFSGWSPEITTVKSNIMYYAVFDSLQRIYGDVTDNMIVDIQDATIVVNYILGERSDNYLYYMADMNSDDEIDIFDLTAIINVILGRTNFMSPMRSTYGTNGYRDYLARNASLKPPYNLEDVYLRTVSDRICLSLDNPERFTSFQLDIEVPDGADLNSIELSESNNTHIVQKSQIGDNLYRVIALSMSSQPLSDNNNELISIRISDAADAEITVSNVMFVTPKGEAYYFNPATTKIPTVIDIVTSDPEDKIYDLSGRRIHRKSTDLDKGVYIINNQKVIIK